MQDILRFLIKMQRKTFFLPTKFPSYINLQTPHSKTFSRFLVDAMFLIVLLVYVIMLVLYLHQVCSVCSAVMEQFELVSLSELW